MTPPAAPTPPKEAMLIRRAREAKGLSPESAAAQMGIRFSGSRWRQIEAGYRKDIRKQVIAKPAVLAHMAAVAGVSADRLEREGEREDAAEVLREIERQEADQQPEQRAAPTTEREVRARLIDITNRLLEAPSVGETRALIEESEDLVARLRELQATRADGRDAPDNRPPERHAG